MPRITLPDGNVLEYDAPVSAARVAADLGPGLAKSSVGALINGELSDLSAVISQDAALKLVTFKPRQGVIEQDALYLLRHSCAHVMAEAIQKLFPGTELVYGPALDNGFYYDIALPDGRPLSSNDFEAIEQEMQKIIDADLPFTRYEMPTADGMKKLEAEGSKYKLDNAQRAIAAGSDKLTWYTTGTPGESWEDLCRGPHVPSTGYIKAFKVMSVAASYWHGDANSDRLTRVYGIAFANSKELAAYLEQLEEAKKRDHRVIGKQLQLFHIDEMVGQGLVLWTPKGSIIRRELEEFIRGELIKQGYHLVYTPHIGKLDLYKTSGHYPYYQDSQYPPMLQQDYLSHLAQKGCSCAELANMMERGEIEGYLLKPMNCPHHIRLFASQRYSYRNLPIRFAEFGTVYRWEQSGEVGGLTRVRGFTQDDAHLFCTEEQVPNEIKGCLKLVNIIFGTLQMKDYRVRVGLRDPDSSKYVGSAEMWDRAERACRESAADLGVPFTEEAGEAAFYGPKIDFIVRDILGREWQLGTVQVDYNLPERFDLKYIGADNNTHRPVMIHRAPFGSLERFIGVLIEHFAGVFPTWLAPEQVRILPLSEKSNDYATKVLTQLQAIGVRATSDYSSEHIKNKILVASDEKIPYLLVVGPRDAENHAVSVRIHGIRENLGAIPTETFITALQQEIQSRSPNSKIRSLFDR